MISQTVVIMNFSNGTLRLVCQKFTHINMLPYERNPERTHGKPFLWNISYEKFSVSYGERYLQSLNIRHLERCTLEFILANLTKNVATEILLNLFFLCFNSEIPLRMSANRH